MRQEEQRKKEREREGVRGIRLALTAGERPRRKSAANSVANKLHRYRQLHRRICRWVGEVNLLTLYTDEIIFLLPAESADSAYWNWSSN